MAETMALTSEQLRLVDREASAWLKNVLIPALKAVSAEITIPKPGSAIVRPSEVEMSKRGQ